MWGTVISIDICNSTDIVLCYSADNEKAFFNIKEKLSRLVNYTISGSESILIAFTGDGALLFVPEEMGLSSATKAIDLSIGFLNNWKSCRLWFTGLEDVKLRIVLDRGLVQTNEEGGLWSGSAIHLASKIRSQKEEYDGDRITITENVYKEIDESHFYKKLFSKTSDIILPKNPKNKEEAEIIIHLFNIELKNEGLASVKPRRKPCTDIVLLISAVNTDHYRLQSVINSIENQSYIPKKIFVVTRYENINICKSNIDIIFCDQNILQSTERAAVRNFLTNKALESNCAFLCYLDGDTILSSDVFMIASNILRSSRNTIFSIPRMELDREIGPEEIGYLTNLFLEKTYTIPYEFIKYWTSSWKETMLAERNVQAFLGSYVLFIPRINVENNGEWDQNFFGWGEEDIDFTYRFFLNGCKLILPKLNGFQAVHLTHSLEKESHNSFMQNAQYLISKHPSIYPYRADFYRLLGL